MFTFASLPPLSLYVHIPWCVRKCPYCDFNSHEAGGNIPEKEYVDALLRDLELDLPRVWGRPIHSVFIGGGTPSLFSPEAIDRLLSGLRARLTLNQEIEITLEANPGTVELERFKGFREAGVNRLSMGIQSFEPEKLKALGRIHGREEALRAAEAAAAAGFDNFNLDLMFGLPGQTVEQALADLRTAIAMGPSHLSAYQLTIEPNTLFHARPPQLPDDDTIADMQDQLQGLLAEHGYRQYEVSAYARPENQCRHNLNYWRFGDYLGIGAGAHAKITDASGITRLARVKPPKSYLEKAGTAAALSTEQKLSRADVITEFMLNALRLTDGFPTPLFQERAGLPLSVCEKPLSLAESKGLIEWDTQTIRPTPAGRRYLNNLLELFV
ncbi:MAG: radical SAM family heme chaperone HemW [Pseudomonadota bacterium]